MSKLESFPVMCSQVTFASKIFKNQPCTCLNSGLGLSFLPQLHTFLEFGPIILELFVFLYNDHSIIISSPISSSSILWLSILKKPYFQFSRKLEKNRLMPLTSIPIGLINCIKILQVSSNSKLICLCYGRNKFFSQDLLFLI